ncbi:MAG: hypothetical protein JWO53_824 [Chlamydiia bacterium]|nr:hypothetical protein [Chlamydiia bacterium]
MSSTKLGDLSGANPVKPRFVEKFEEKKALHRPLQSTRHEESKSKFKEALDKKNSSKDKKGSDKEKERDGVAAMQPVCSLFDLASDSSLFEETEDSATADAPLKASPYYMTPAMSLKEIMAETSTPQEVRSPLPSTLVKLIDELVSQLKVMTKSDRTETSITLQNPPLLRGVSLVITEFQSAQKEFNLTFHNLTNVDARLLIESKQNQEGLALALAEKGYTLQMVTIEPKLHIEAVVSSEMSEPAHHQDRQNDDGKEQDSQGHFA